MVKIKRTPFRLVTTVLTTLVLFSTIGNDYFTLTANAEEAVSESRFIPFRSYIVPYIVAHSADEGQDIIDQWLRIWAEQSTYSSGAKSWADKYYAAYMGDGGEYVPENSAKGKELIYNSEYDSYIANTIKSNGLNFLNQWLNASGEVNATGGTFSGKDVFINYFNGTAYLDFTSTSEAIIELTKTSEGFEWLQNYSYANTGDIEASVGVGLLKLLALNWEKLNENQIKWCKEYLPFLLQNYRDYGNEAIADQSRNSSLYDFMARSIDGAQCTFNSKVSGKNMRQEFYDYVVSSKNGYGEFIQNVIGGSTYTATINGWTFSNVDLKVYQSSSALHLSPDADIDYSSASAGDGDTDWFNHSMYLYSIGSGYSQFETVYNLVMNNETAKTDYLEWLARFHGRQGGTERWNYRANQNRIGGTGYVASANWVNYMGGKANATGSISTGDPAWVAAFTHAPDLLCTNSYGSLRPDNWGRPGQWGSITSWNYVNDSTYQWYTPLNQDYSYFNTVTLTFTYSATGGLTAPSGGIKVNIRGNSPTGPVVVSSTATTSATLQITASQWEEYDQMYLEVIIPAETIKTLGSRVFNCQCGFYLGLSDVSFGWIGSEQKCIDGHDFDEYVYSYSKDYKEVTISHKCKVCDMEESEVLSIDNGKVAVIDEDNALETLFTYTPNVLNVDSWTESISKDVGTGTVTYNSASGSDVTSGIWNAYNNKYNPTKLHTLENGTWIAVTSESVTSSGTFSIKKNVIKANAKSITVNSVHTSRPERISINVFDKNNKLLQSNTGSGSVTIDLSDLTLKQKDGCYITVSHNRNNYGERRLTSAVWSVFPPEFSLDVYSTISNVVVTY